MDGRPSPPRRGRLMTVNRNGPLSGTRIIDFTWAWAGPYGASLLAWLGADVIKVESSTRLDASRERSLTVGAFQGGFDQMPMFNELNLGKRSLALNLKTPQAKQIVKQLAAVSDAVVDNFRPGTLDRLGLGYDILNAERPNIVMVSASALGATGPERGYAGYAPIFAALAGLAHLSGYADGPPALMGGNIDLRAGTVTALTLLLALYHRDRTGIGQFVDVSARDAVAMHIGETFLEVAMHGRDPQRRGNEHPAFAPHDVYRCAPAPPSQDSGKPVSEWVAIACRSDDDWDALIRATGLDELRSDPRFRTGLRRWKQRAQLNPIIESWTGRRSAQEAARVLLAAGVPAAPSQHGAQLYRDPHFLARGNAVTIKPPMMEERAVIASPMRMSRTPAAITKPAPLLGEDSSDVLSDLLGYDEAQIDALRAAGVLE